MDGNEATGNQADARAARHSYVALAVGLALILVFACVRSTAANPVVYLVVAGYGTALAAIGAARMPRRPRRVWSAFAVAQALFLAGDVAWTIYDNVLHVAPSPSLADAGYLARYPVFALGILWLVRQRWQRGDRAAFLDAAILTTGVTVAGLVFLVAPAFASAGMTLTGQLVAAAYPVGDLLLLAVAFRLMAGGMARNEALWGLLASVVALLVVDLAYGASVTLATPYPGWIDVGYLASYVFLGFAALHPSAPALSEPSPVRAGGITIVRLSWLGLALVLGPLTARAAALGGLDDHPWVVLVGCCVAAVLVVLRLWDLVGYLQRNTADLEALAGRDGLTGVANRRTWDDELHRACAFARKNRAPFTVAVLDLDHFKEFNDAHGHLAGDDVLRETTAAWASMLGGPELLARYGGEEFTVLLPFAGTSEVHAVLDRMRLIVSHGQTCSIGAATLGETEGPAELMARADEALYCAKRSGRDRIALHADGAATLLTPSYESSAVASLRAVYQPICDLRTGEVVGVEALSRFPGHNPREVFDNAQRDGTAPALEAAAITAAIEGWNRRGLLSLNVSLSTLVTQTVRRALPDDLTSLVLEITETDLVDYGPDVMQVLEEVRGRGALLAIDDFGVGFSNVHRIAVIRPDIVKIDMSLVRGIDADTALQAVVNACLLYAGLTGTRVVAEGIETAEELDCLVALGVELGQGFLLGMPAELPDASPLRA